MGEENNTHLGSTLIGVVYIVHSMHACAVTGRLLVLILVNIYISC